MVEDYLARAVSFIEVNRVWAGPVVAVMAFGESLAFVGILVPATAALLAIGALVGAGSLDPWPIVAGAVIGAVLGDWLSYLLGRAIGPRVYHRWPLNRHRHAVARTRLFFRRYGFATVFAGRFLGPVRATVPLMAGVLRMDRGRFQLANVGSALVWAPVLFLPGYVAGDAMAARGGIDDRDMLMFGAGVAALTLVAGWLSRHLLMRRRQRPSGRPG